MIPLLLALLHVARAEDASIVVFSAGSADSAIADVRRELGDAGVGARLEAQRLGDALSGPPTVIGGGHSERCKVTPATPVEGGPVPAERFVAQANEVQQRVRDGAFEQALGTARRAEPMLPCLTETVSRESVRDYYLAWATAAARVADSYATIYPDKATPYRDEASRAYDAWRRFIPDEHELSRRADAIGTPDGRAIASALLERKLLSTSFQVVPRVSELWVDGTPVRPDSVARLVTGRHLVQYRGAPAGAVASLWVQLDANAPATLALPELLPADVTRWADDDQLRPQLAALLGILGEGELYVLTPEGHVWRGAPGDPRDWERVLAEGGDRRGLRAAGRITTISGGALIGAGAITMGVACAASKGRTEGEAWYQCGDELPTASFQTFAVAQDVVLGGLATLGVGLTLDLLTRGDVGATLSLAPGAWMVGVRVVPGARTRSAGVPLDRGPSPPR